MVRYVVSIAIVTALGCGVETASGPVAPVIPNTSVTPAGISILAWNIESGGSNTETILLQLQSMPPFNVLALSEVPATDASRLADYFGMQSGLAGTSNGDDCLVLAWSSRFRLVAGRDATQGHVQEFAPGWHSKPLAVHLQDSFTGRDFIVVNNHLARSDAILRSRQAELLVNWARDENLPIIAVGDYNMDYDFPTAKGNEAFAAMLTDGVYKWIKPKEFIDTNWADRNGDGVDDYPDSMLDFVFVAGPAMDWDVTAEVIVRAGDFPDDETTSDHRPVLTVVDW